MFEILHFEFMRNAILAGLLASIICGAIGTLVVVNRIVFLASGIAHAAYGGIGLAIFLGLPYMFGTISFSILVALIMAIVAIKAKNRSDTIIGVLWAVGMAFGVILMDLKPGYNVDLMSYLFGSILAVPTSDLWIMFSLSCIIILVIVYFYNQLLAMSFDEEFARLRGVPVGLLYFFLLAMIAVSVVIAIRLVGLILIIALLTIPPFISEKYVKSLYMMMILSALLNSFFIIIGLWLSYTLNLTSGAVIIMVAGITFFISILADRLYRIVR